MATPAPPRLPAGERLRRVGVGAWSIIGILILAAIAVWVLRRISIIFPPLILALLIIYLLNPVVTRLQQRRVPRGAGVLISYLGVFAVVAVLWMLLVPRVSAQATSLREQWPEYRVEMARSIENAAGSIEDRFGVVVPTAQLECLLGADEEATLPQAPSRERCDEITQDLRETLAERARSITSIASTALEVLLIFILAPLLALYLLLDLPQLQRDILNLFPDTHRREIADLGSKAGAAIGGFFRGQLLVALVVGVLSSIGFALIGLPFWIVVGAIAGFFNLIPLVGPYIGGFIGFLVGVMSGDVRLGLYAVAVELVVQQIDNHLISPKVMQRTVNLHPVTVMLSILAGGAVMGFWGVLLAVPTVAVAKILLGHVWATRVLGHEVSPYGESGARGIEPPSVVPSEEAEDATDELEPHDDGAKARKEERQPSEA